MTAVAIRVATLRHRLLLGALITGIVGVPLGARAIDLPPFDAPGIGAPAGAASAAERRAVAAYASAIGGPVDAAAFTVAEGMRPGVRDIAEGGFAGPVLVQMADSWLASVREVRAELAAISPPASLSETHRLHLRALDGYVDAARALVAAAAATGDARTRHLDLAATAGQRADDTYDLAAAELERARLRHTIAPTEEHP